MDITFVSVVTNFNQYHKLFTNNPHVQKYTLRTYDNRKENLPIPARYNHFIDNELSTDGWVIFCHQDFEFLQDPAPVLEKLDKKFIYGPVGVALQKQKNLHLIFYKHRLKPSLHVKAHFNGVWKGWIHQGDKDECAGEIIHAPEIVDTVDCCCIFMHSSLIRQHALRFDPQFNFHCYCEDFCLAARQKEVFTKAVQLSARHYSSGDMNKLFWQKYDALLNKYPAELFSTTCVSSPQAIFGRLLGKRYEQMKTIFEGKNLSDTDNIARIKNFFYSNTITSHGYRLIKICKIPVWHKKI